VIVQTVSWLLITSKLTPAPSTIGRCEHRREGVQLPGVLQAVPHADVGHVSLLPVDPGVVVEQARECLERLP
jgi:hypothetical protein